MKREARRGPRFPAFKVSLWRRHPRIREEPRPVSPVEVLDSKLSDPAAPVEDVLTTFVLAAIDDFAAAEARLVDFEID
ncbi:hypothetical protein DFR67_106141 [Williamsia limnetica]|uniref:Uncharacterized protein n=1 Tax=Williamsia limnetica TaxID=882452 RepID=A0A318S212_WILLI|nr:hypothetical protein [Williamsia limnetica]PYE17438.1 hypothetical protein DFR67_106141 [Williamsia limnetica]